MSPEPTHPSSNDYYQMSAYQYHHHHQQQQHPHEAYYHACCPPPSRNNSYPATTYPSLSPPPPISTPPSIHGNQNHIKMNDDDPITDKGEPQPQSQSIEYWNQRLADKERELQAVRDQIQQAERDIQKQALQISYAEFQVQTAKDVHKKEMRILKLSIKAKKHHHHHHQSNQQQQQQIAAQQQQEHMQQQPHSPSPSECHYHDDSRHSRTSCNSFSTTTTHTTELTCNVAQHKTPVTRTKSLSPLTARTQSMSLSSYQVPRSMTSTTYNATSCGTMTARATDIPSSSSTPTPPTRTQSLRLSSYQVPRSMTSTRSTFDAPQPIPPPPPLSPQQSGTSQTSLSISSFNHQGLCRSIPTSSDAIATTGDMTPSVAAASKEDDYENDDTTQDTNHATTIDDIHDNENRSLVPPNGFEIAKWYCDEPYQQFESCRRTLGPNHPDTLKAIHRVARALDEQGRYDPAAELYQFCLARQSQTRNQTYEDNEDNDNDNYSIVSYYFHPDCLETMNSLAGVYYKQGRYDESQTLNEQCLEYKEKVLGRHHPSTWISMTNLATVILKNHRVKNSKEGRIDHLPKAEYYFRWCLDCKLKSLGGGGEDHPEVLTLTANLAHTYFYQGYYDEAKELYNVCYQKRRIVNGEDHVDTLAVLHRFAVTCSKLEAAAGQQEHEQQQQQEKGGGVVVAVGGFAGRVVGNDNNNTENDSDDDDSEDTAEQLERQEKRRQNQKEAATAFETCWKHQVKVLGLNHPETLATQNNYALALLSLSSSTTSEHDNDDHDKDDYNDDPQSIKAKAQSLLEECLERQTKVLGPRHPETINTQKNLKRFL